MTLKASRAAAPASDCLIGMNSLEATAWSPRHGLYDLLDEVFCASRRERADTAVHSRIVPKRYGDGTVSGSGLLSVDN